jgi:glycosyltransferase involved in cell wall biosynthesis
MHVAFVNENTLGHASYLRPLIRGFVDRPELGIIPHGLDATPLTGRWKWWGEFSVRGLRRWGLDFHNRRWRLTVSHEIRRRLEEMRQTQPLDAVVVNTQSVGLCLADLAAEIPVFVALDATFSQLAASPWFAPNRPSRWLQPLTMGALRHREKQLFQRARGFFPWSALAGQSLRDDYGIEEKRIHWLPPSIIPQPAGQPWPRNARPRILFLGGDFRRKGGYTLLECYRRFLMERFDLHVITQTEVPATPGVQVHRGIESYSPGWFEQWRQADVFVFPSTLETFGIVLLEALAFQVPVVSCDVGAAREVLAQGRAGLLVPTNEPAELARAIEQVFQEPDATRARVEQGLRQIEAHYTLSVNLRRLADVLHGVR